jgi:hypothetical protein
MVFRPHSYSDGCMILNIALMSADESDISAAHLRPPESGFVSLRLDEDSKGHSGVYIVIRMISQISVR